MQQFAAKSPEASRLRQRKYALLREFALPEDLVGGCLSQTHRRCGRSNCHCAEGRGHPQWSVTFSHHGERRVERVPDEWRGDLEHAILKTQAYLEAIKEVMAINLELLAQTRSQEQKKKVRRAQKKEATVAKNDQLSPAVVDLLTM